MSFIIENFELLSERPEHVRELKKLVLDLAIKGQLVPQNVKDESVEILLKKIRSEKEELFSNGKMKKQKPFPPLKTIEFPFVIPSNWSWCRLIDIISLLGDGIHGTPEYSQNGNYYFINGNNLSDGEILIKNNTKKVSEKEYQKHKKNLNNKTVLVSINGTIGNVAFYKNEAVMLGKSACYFNLLGDIEKMYIKLLIQSEYFRDYAFNSATGTTIKNVSLKTMRSLPLPLPPIAEQLRIVEKVNSLFQKIDTLADQTQRAQITRQKLRTAFLHRLDQADSATQLSQAWQSLIPQFDRVFDSVEAIKALRKSILQLAVKGKLVEQNGEDESASVLLEKIKKEKERLVEEGKIKKEKLYEPVLKKDFPFELPLGWKYTRMAELCDNITSGSTPSKDKFRDSEGIPYLKVYNIRKQKINFNYRPQFIEEEIHSKKLKRSILRPNDIVMNIVGPPLGKIAIIPTDFPEWNCNQAIAVFRLIQSNLSEYVYLFLCEGSFLKNIELIGTAGQDNISVTKSKNIIIPLPPLAEQKRIVEKVGQLMSWCDDLESLLEKRAAKKERLLGRVLKGVFEGEAIQNV